MSDIGSLYRNKLVYKIPVEPHKLGSLLFAYRFRSTDRRLSISYKFLVELFPYFGHRHFV